MTPVSLLRVFRVRLPPALVATLDEGERRYQP